MESMNDNQRNEDGTYTPRHPREEFLNALEDGPATTAEVADAVGIHIESARYRLERLVEAGAVATTTAGRTKIWTLKDRGDDE